MPIARQKKLPEGLYWTPLGGNNIDEMSANAHVYQVRSRNAAGVMQDDIVLVDLGKLDRTAGHKVRDLETVMPDARPYLRKRDGTHGGNGPFAKALFVTHGHNDHIGGITGYIQAGYALPDIHCSSYTRNLIIRSLVEKNVPREYWPPFKALRPGTQTKFGGISVEPVAVSHSCPGAYGFAIKGAGVVHFHSGDIKVDQTLLVGPVTDMKRLEALGREGVASMTFDMSTTSRKGFARAEGDIQETYFRLFEEAKGKPVIAALAGGHLERILTVAAAAHRSGRKVIIDGNTYLDAHVKAMTRGENPDHKLPEGLELIDGKSDKARAIPPEQAVIITTGNYGERAGPLFGMCHGTHPRIKITGDHVIINQSAAKPNYQAQLDAMLGPARLAGAKVITGVEVPGIDGSGHGQLEDIKTIHKIVKPKVTIPMHGFEMFTDRFMDMATANGINTGGVRPKNGVTFKLAATGVSIAKVALAKWVGLPENPTTWQRTAVAFAQMSCNGQKNKPPRMTATTRGRKTRANGQSRIPGQTGKPNGRKRHAAALAKFARASRFGR